MTCLIFFPLSSNNCHCFQLNLRVRGFETTMNTYEQLALGLSASEVCDSELSTRYSLRGECVYSVTKAEILWHFSSHPHQRLFLCILGYLFKERQHKYKIHPPLRVSDKYIQTELMQDEGRGMSQCC